MTTARDVIAKAISADCYPDDYDAADRVIADLLSAPEPVRQELAALLNPWRPIETLKIEYLGGNCPVQAEGAINGQPFYFRARGEHWSFGVGDDPVGDPAWYLCMQWGDSEFAAGWMEEKEARCIIAQCAAAYRATLPVPPSEDK